MKTYNTFEFVGKIHKVKDGVNAFQSKTGTKVYSAKFGIKADGNWIRLEMVGFKPADNSSVTYFKKNKEKGKIPFTKRFDIDTSELSYAHPSYNDNKFITDFDFVTHISSLLENDMLEGRYCKVSGNIKYEFYVKDGVERFVTKYIPRHIEVLKDQDIVDERALANINMYLDEDSFGRIENTGVIKGYSVESVYSNGSNTLKTVPIRIEYNLGDRPDEAFQYIKNSERYAGGSGDSLRQIGVKVAVINKAEERELEMDDLTTDQKMRIELGLDTLESIRAEFGSGKGSFESKYVRVSELRGFSDGSKESTVTKSEIGLAPKKNAGVDNMSDVFATTIEDGTSINDIIPDEDLFK